MPELARHLCIDGQADAANQRITDALGVQDTQPESGDEEDNDIEQAARNARHKAGRTVSVTAPTTPVRGFSAPVRGPSPVPTDA